MLVKKIYLIYKCKVSIIPYLITWEILIPINYNKYYRSIDSN